nr:hypothetical protein [uncultured Butyrivibrio sp.]
MEMSTKTELATSSREENKKGSDITTTGKGGDEAVDKDLNYKGVGLLDVE